MKTQRRRDNGGSAPPPSHDDYDDYEDGQSSAEETLAASNGQAYSSDLADESALSDEEIVPSPARSATNGSNGANADGHSNGSGVSSSPRVRPPASSLPKRRPRPGDVVQAASVADVPESPVTQAPIGGNGHANGNGKSKNGNGITNGAMSATAVAPARSSRNIPPPPAPMLPPVSEAVVSGPPETLPARVFRLFVTYETLIYFTIFALALFTRFWDIGNRGIHHDESLHSVYSRNLYIGLGYTHDPMMHGPIQFNLIALMYWLFGTSDTTARFASATCGVWVVMSPFFLRRQMGRWPALIASFLLLIAPGVLYFSRMAREDSVFSAMEMIMIVGLWRFISTRRPVDFFVFCAGLSLMFTIKETAYLSVAVVGSLFAILFAVQAGYAVLGALAAYGVAMGGLLLYVNGGMKSGAIAALPNIPAQNPDYTTIMTFASNLLSHPIVQGAVLITLVFVGLIIGLLSIHRESLARIIATWAIVLAVLRIGIAFIIADNIVNVLIEIIAMAAALALGAGIGYLITRGGQIHSASAVFDYDATAPRASIAGRSARPTRPASSVSSTSAGVPRRRSRVLDAELADDDVVVTTPVTVAPVLEPAVPVSTGYGVPAPAYALATDTAASEVYDPKRLDPKPGTLLAHYEPGSLPYLIGSLFSRPSVLIIGFLIAATIFTVLYTVFFTDVPRGIASGLFASLGYWMAQQGVARGGQPWYYYLLIVPLYQPIAVFFSLASGVFFAVKGIRGFLRHREERLYSEQEQPRLGLFNTDRPVPFAKFSVLLPLFLVWWLAGAFFIYSWAGEKMPWLMMHLTRPAILLASLFLGALLASIVRRRQERVAWVAEYTPSYGAPTIPMSERRVAPGGRAQVAGARNQVARAPQYAVRTTAQPVLTQQDPPWVSWNRPNSLFPVVSFMMIITVLALSWGLKLNALTSTGIGTSDYSGWGVSWLYPIAVVAVLVAYSVWLGPGRVFRYLGVAIFSILFLYEFRSATNLVYQHPDVPTELAVYVQTSPSTTSAVAALNEYSDFATGGPNLKVVYDSFTSWPFEWYLRDYKNKKFIGGTAAPDDAGTDTSAAVMFLEYAKVNDSIVTSKVNDAQKQVNDAQAQIATLNSEPQSADRDSKLATAQAQQQAAQTTLTNWGSFQKNYILQRYAMRWWFPEDWYKNDLIKGETSTSPIQAQAGAIINTTAQTFTNPQMSATLWNYLIFRQLPKPLGSEDMVVAIRKDVAQTYHYLQYQPPNTTDEPPGDVQNPPIESSEPSAR